MGGEGFSNQSRGPKSVTVTKHKFLKIDNKRVTEHPGYRQRLDNHAFRDRCPTVRKKLIWHGMALRISTHGGPENLELGHYTILMPYLS